MSCMLCVGQNNEGTREKLRKERQQAMSQVPKKKKKNNYFSRMKLGASSEVMHIFTCFLHLISVLSTVKIYNMSSLTRFLAPATATGSKERSARCTCWYTSPSKNAGKKHDNDARTSAADQPGWRRRCHQWHPNTPSIHPPPPPLLPPLPLSSPSHPRPSPFPYLLLQVLLFLLLLPSSLLVLRRLVHFT